MTTPRALQQRTLSFFLLTQTCLSTPLHPRSQGTSVSAAPPTTTKTTRIIPGWKNPTAIVFLVAVISLALTIPMFVYIWLKRRRLLRVRTEPPQPPQKQEIIKRKLSIASTVDMPLTPRRVRESMGAETVIGPVTFAEPVKISVRPIRAVEIIVKPAKAVFRDPSWEKLKS